MRIRPTLQTIADRAGVSRNTVSAILRGLPGFAAGTREQIQNLAIQLGYQANPMVSALMRSIRNGQPAAHRGNLAYLHPYGESRQWAENSFLRELFEGTRVQGAQLGFHVDPVWMSAPEMTGARLTKMLVARGVEGVIISSLLRARGRFHLDWSKFASVSLGFSLWRPALHRVATNQYHVMGLAVRNLRRLGYARVGAVISHEIDARFDYAWEAGMVTVSNSLPKRARIPPLTAENLKTKIFENWLRKHKVDAVIDGGAGLEKHLQALRVNVPDDLGFVSLLADGAPNGPATVRPDWTALGAAALDVVAEQLIRNERGIPLKPRTVLIEGEWVAGATVKKTERSA